MGFRYFHSNGILRFKPRSTFFTNYYALSWFIDFHDSCWFLLGLWNYSWWFYRKRIRKSTQILLLDKHVPFSYHCCYLDSHFHYFETLNYCSIYPRPGYNWANVFSLEYFLSVYIIWYYLITCFVRSESFSLTMCWSNSNFIFILGFRNPYHLFIGL